MRRILVVVGLSLAGGIAVVACGGDDETSGSTTTAPGGGCNDNPFECPAGQTCWLVGASVADAAFQCMNSGQGQIGDDCDSIIGMPKCGDDLMCIQQTQGSPGVCTPYCDSTDPAHACPGNAPCLTAPINGDSSLVVHVCQPGAGVGGGGGTGGAGGTPATGGGGAGGAGGTAGAGGV